MHDFANYQVAVVIVIAGILPSTLQIFVDKVLINTIVFQNQNLSTLDLISQHSNSFNQLSLHQPQSMLATPYYPSTSQYTTLIQSNPSLTSLPAHQFSTLPIQTLGIPTLNKDSQLSNSRVSRSNFQIYSQLQLPSLSNNGSMKKKKKRQESDQLPPSPDSSPPPPSQSPASSPPQHTEQEYYDGDVRIWQVEYVPQVMSIKKKTVKV